MRRVLTVIFIALFAVIVGEMGYYFLILSPSARSAPTQEKATSTLTPTPFNLSDPSTYANNRYIVSESLLKNHLITGLDIVYHISLEVTAIDTTPGETGVVGTFDIVGVKPTPRADALKYPYTFKITFTGAGENNKGQQYIYFHKPSDAHLIKFTDSSKGEEKTINGEDFKVGDLIEATHVYDTTKPDNYSSLIEVKFNRIHRTE